MDTKAFYEHLIWSMWFMRTLDIGKSIQMQHEYVLGLLASANLLGLCDSLGYQRLRTLEANAMAHALSRIEK